MQPLKELVQQIRKAVDEDVAAVLLTDALVASGVGEAKPVEEKTYGEWDPEGDCVLGYLTDHPIDALATDVSDALEQGLVLTEIRAHLVRMFREEASGLSQETQTYFRTWAEALDTGQKVVSVKHFVGVDLRHYAVVTIGDDSKLVS